jgi:tetratricopeptide (TPR) repeat protein
MISEVVRVVVASPSDVARECAVAQTVIDELNRGAAADRGCRLSLWRWEIDARPGVHLQGPQGLIDQLMNVQKADVVVGVFWKRFGTPTSTANSGTEHELRRALAAWQEHGRPELMVYFSTRAYAPKTADELEQWQRVLEFRDELPPQLLSWLYSNAPDFERLLREHLTRYLQSRAAVTQAASPAASGPRVRFNLPAVVASFTGREPQLDALDDALGVADSAIVTQAVTGLGGVGKSQLVARYVQQRADRYDIVAWIRAEDGGITDLASLASKLGVAAAGMSPGDQAQAALEWLGDSEQRWLLVLDNVESSAELDRLRPRTGSGRVLVTSRDRSLRQFGPVLTIGVLDEDAATEFLIQRTGRTRDEQAARQLAAALGCLPLALSHAAGYCQDGTSFTDYLELLGELPADELFDSCPELSYAKTVARTWKASIGKAAADAPLAVHALEMAAYLAPEAIPKALFGVLVDAETGARRKRRLADTFNALARYSLATVDDDTISVHRLLQKTVRDDAAVREEQTDALRALRAVNDTFPTQVRLPKHWSVCEQLLPHAFTLADTLKQPGIAASELVGVLNRAIDYLNRTEAGDRGVVAACRALEHAERLLGATHPDTLTTRDHLGCAYHWAGRDADALTVFEPLLADGLRILGAEHLGTMSMRHNLARTYLHCGRVDDAVAMCEALLADRERILGSEHPETLSTRHNLASCYHDAGRDDEALAMYEALLADRERIIGHEHPETFNSRHNLALCYHRAGRHHEAIAIFEPLLLDRERSLGPEHPRTLTTRHNLAIAHHAVDRIPESIAICEPLLAERERILGIDHPDTLSTRDYLAHAYHDIGRVNEATTIYEQLASDRERILGIGHPDTLRTRQDLADAHRGAARSTEEVEGRDPLGA